jgi:glucose 1-dehydrogenase
MPKLEGKVALVTGGNQGIGRGIVFRLAADGANVAIIYRKDQREAEAVIQELEQKNRRGVAIRADLAVVTEIEPAVNEAIRQLGHLDILVNNAGLEKNAPFWEVTEQDYDAVLNVNLKAVFFVGPKGAHQ